MDFESFEYHVPRECKCGSRKLRYEGLGEYICEECGTSCFDDYGLVRNYIEHHSGASVPRVSRETGVPVSTIRKMIEEGKFDFLEKDKNKLK